MAFRAPQLQSLIQNVVNSPNASNFNDYVKYARGTLNTGQTPSGAGFQQYMTGIYGPSQQPPGGNKGQRQLPAPSGAAPAGPVTEAGQLSRVPSPMGAAQPVPTAPPKGGRNLQYAAALSRMK
jgi:hypothetical protein